jgi:hypothetical protein
LGAPINSGNGREPHFRPLDGLGLSSSYEIVDYFPSRNGGSPRVRLIAANLALKTNGITPNSYFDE